LREAYATRGHHGHVRRIATFAAAWIVAAAVAVGVAWQGVGIVTTKVTDERPGPLSAGEVRELASGATSTTTTVDSSAASSTTVPGAAGSPTNTAPAPTTTTPTPSTGTPATTTAPPATTSTTAPPQSPAPETRTYNLVGGSAALRFTSGGVTVVWATPNSGFEVLVEPENVNGVRVRFESDGHRSRVDGWWDGGPVDRVREEPR
jgi:hypothetical protein